MCFLDPAKLHSLIGRVQNAIFPVGLYWTGVDNWTCLFSHYLLTRFVFAAGEKSQMEMNDKSEFSAIPLIISFKHGHSHFSSMLDFVTAHYIKQL